MSFKNTLINFMIFLISISLIPTFIYEYSIRDPSIFFLPKKSISLIIIGIVIWYFHKYDEGYYDDDDYNKYTYGDNVYYNNRTKNKYIYNYPICQRTDFNTYEKITKAYTDKKVNELLKSKEFIKMTEEKGEDRDNWNWQSRDRLSGKKQKDESDISSDELENMTVSDD